MNTKQIAVSATFLTLLAGCGGGGGGGSSPSAQTPTGSPGSTTPGGSGTTTGGTGTGTGAGSTTTTTAATGPIVPIEQALINLYTAGKAFNRTNVIGNDTYVVMATYTNTGAGNFEGAPVTKESIVRYVTKNGSFFYSSDQTDYFETAPAFKIDGRLFPNQAASYYVTSASSFTKLPAFGKPGDSGSFYTATIYDSSNKSVTIGTATQTWNVAADTSSSALFCINTILQIGSNSTTQDDCYKITTTGEVPSVLFSTPNTTKL